MDRVGFQSCQTSLWHQSQRFPWKKKKCLCHFIQSWTHLQWFWKIRCHSHCGYTVLISHDRANLSEEPRMSYCLTMPRLTFAVENHNHPLLQTTPVELPPRLIHPIQGMLGIPRRTRETRNNRRFSSKGRRGEQLGRQQQALHLNSKHEAEGQEGTAWDSYRYF